MRTHLRHPRNTRRQATIRASLTTVTAALLAGCTVMMTDPVRPDAVELARGLTYAEAIAYLERARANMSSAQDRVDQLDDVTRLGIGVGVGGGAINMLAKGRPDVTLGLLGMGGLGYSVAQVSGVPTQRQIYGAGLDSLDCIDRTGRRVYRETDGTRDMLLHKKGELDAAVALLSDHLDALARAATPEPEAALMAPQAHEVLRTGITLQQSVRDFMNATDVASEMYYGVGKTVRAVNTQLRSRAPSLEEIAKSGTILVGFTTAHAPVAADAQATKSAAQGVPAVSQAETEHPVTDRLTMDVHRLRQVADDIKALLPASGYATAQLLDACQSLVPGQLPFRIKPAGPIRVTAGGDAYALSIESEMPVVYGFHGAQPSAQQLVVSQPSDRTFSLAAPAGAKGQTYHFYVAQKGGRELPNLEVTVVASTPETTSTTTKKNPAQTNVPKLTFEQKRKLVGLGDDVKSVTDAAFTDRVKKLDNCFEIIPSTGALSANLIAKLNESEVVNSQGDCPEPKAKTKAEPPQKPGSGSTGNNNVPIPKPPKPGASN